MLRYQMKCEELLILLVTDEEEAKMSLPALPSPVRGKLRKLILVV